LLNSWHEKALKAKQGGTLQLRSKLPFSQDHMHSEHRTAMCAIYPDLNKSGEVESVMFLIMDISEVKWIEVSIAPRLSTFFPSPDHYDH
jgi:hypothetical protein